MNVVSFTFSTGPQMRLIIGVASACSSDSLVLRESVHTAFRWKVIPSASGLKRGCTRTCCFLSYVSKLPFCSKPRYCSFFPRLCVYRVSVASAISKHREDHLYIVNRGRLWLASFDRDASVLPASLWLGSPDSVLLYRLSLLHPSVVD